MGDEKLPRLEYDPKWNPAQDDLAVWIARSRREAVDWLDRAVQTVVNAINTERRYLLSKNYSEEERKELAALDAVMQHNIGEGRWVPLNFEQAKTLLGLYFVRVMNEKVNGLRKREEMAGTRYQLPDQRR